MDVVKNINPVISNKNQTPFDEIKSRFHKFLINPKNSERLHGFGNRLSGVPGGGEAARKTFEALQDSNNLQTITLGRYRSLIRVIDEGYNDKKVGPKLRENAEKSEFDQFKLDESFKKNEIQFSRMLNFSDIWYLLTHWEVEQEEDYIKFKVKMEEFLKENTKNNTIHSYYLLPNTRNSLVKIVEPDVLDNYSNEIRTTYDFFDSFFNVDNARINRDGSIKVRYSDLLLKRKSLADAIKKLIDDKINIYVGQERLFGHSVLIDNNIDAFKHIKINVFNIWGLQIAKSNKLEVLNYHYHENENSEQKIFEKTLERINYLENKSIS